VKTAPGDNTCTGSAPGERRNGVTKLIETTHDGAVAIVTLNQPEKRNALSVQMRHEFVEALEGLQMEEDCRAIVVTGAGGAFCSGGDISAMRSDDPVGARYRLVLAQRIVRLLTAGQKPTVAAVEGPALGGGFALALACDKVIASRDASFGASYARLGLMPDMALIWTLPQRVGMGKAKEIMMLGKPLSGEAAAALGIVDVLADPASVLEVALQEARTLAGAAPLAVAAVKAAFARGPMDLEAAFALEADGQVMLYQTADHAEAREAFFAKRKPDFKGR
jgi:enoyl-CoA hydratase/carnithine racemase